jgi:asparagine synthase (glutamine-hydrolysing)
MSGICGVCEPGAVLQRGCVEAMVGSLARHGETGRETAAGPSIALGVARRWPGQQLASIPGVRIAANTDLIDTAELNLLARRSGLDPAILTTVELLAWAYKLQGIKFVDLLAGAFALAIWDEDTQRLQLVVDRFGINSLYWSLEAGRLWFASQPGAITNGCGGAPGLSPDAIVQFLLFSTIPAPLSIYRGVERVRPGHILIFEAGQCRESCYWDIRYVESREHNEQEWADQLRSHMRNAVQRHVTAGQSATTGAYLSGGTDSSSVVAFMSEYNSPVNTFSIFFEDPRYSEVAFARTTAEHFKTRHFEKALSPADAFDAIEKVAEYYAEPFANSSAIGGYHCALLARENGVNTLLGGDGGDELFAGNERYAIDRQFQIYHSIPAILRRGLLEPLARMLPDNSSRLSLPRRYIKRASIPNPARIFSYSHFLSAEPASIFERDFLRQVPRDQWLRIAEDHFSRQQASELNRFLYMDLKMTLTDNDIPKVVGTAEMAGVKARFPLLDHRLAEFSALIPSRLKLKGMQKRYIFKKAMKGTLPDTVLLKKKHGFGVPLASWFLRDKRLNSLMHDVLGDSRTRQRGIFLSSFLDQLLELHRHEHAVFYGEIIWYVMVLELWQRRQSASMREYAIAH